MKSIVIILFTVGVLFIVYSFRSPQSPGTTATAKGESKSSQETESAIEASEEASGENFDTSATLPVASNNISTRPIIDEQFAPSLSTQSFFKNLFDQKSAFLSYPFSSDLIFQNAAMAQQMKRLQEKQTSVLPVSVDSIVSAAQDTPVKEPDGENEESSAAL